MSHTNYTFSLTEGPAARQKLLLRSIASARYGGDWHSTPHAHSHTELFYIVGGDGQFQIDGRLFPVRAHQMVVVNPNILHTEVSYEAHPLEYIVLGIEGLELRQPDSGEARYCIYSFPEHNDVLNCMQQLLQEMQDRKARLMRTASVSVTESQARFPTNRQCATVRQYIEQHYKENLTLDLLAEKASINKYYMAHAFKREYGVSPINFLIACRIREGKRLLGETDLSLSQIATVLGFSSPSYFSQSFRSAEGMSPTEYRKANRIRHQGEIPE